ncbi:MAG: ATP-dependent endonuclease [Phycisphaerae bacterium]|nr:ATP-dependent endonuclease [Phycisphaerae bacterium]
MKLAHISVENYKGLREIESNLSDFVCAVGENNAGKSSLLQALLLFVNGTKLSSAEFYEPDKEILIKVRLTGVTGETLSTLTDEHRTKIEPYVDAENLVLARRYATDGSSKLRIVTLVPRDPKYHADQIDAFFKGKKGKENGEALRTFYPETTTPAEADNVSTQKAAKEIIERYINAMPVDQLAPDDIPLPTGIDNSIRSLLPEPVYIPAVKDLTDDLKTKESASFGKLLNILLDVIEDDLTEAAETFENLRKKLNRVVNEDGSITDDRMDRVKEIENTIQTNLQETFRNVTIELEIPPPEIKTVLSNATIVADDGVRGPVDNKGDGFKRAITFSILRSYVQLSQDTTWKKDAEDAKPTRKKFLFLFEEPELYLHPRAQNILYDALALISEKHQVIVTTHSPFFFSAEETKTFVKVKKVQNEDLPKPIGECLAIDLTDVTEKDKFQLISFESSNLAFFSNRIVLVEGDSELIALPHIAQLLDSRWDFKSTSTNLIKISGKGSFKRYSDFFSRFNVDVAIVADLDVLIEGYDKIEPSEHAIELREQMLKEVDTIIDEENKLPEPKMRLLRDELQRDRAQRLYHDICAARSGGDHDTVSQLLDELFIFERTKPRMEILKDTSRPEILDRKRELLSELRTHHVYVLEKGAIEDYYPAGVTGPDKPTKAQCLCNIVNTPEAVRAMCDEVDVNGAPVSEFDAIFQGIFSG